MTRRVLSDGHGYRAYAYSKPEPCCLLSAVLQRLAWPPCSPRRRRRWLKRAWPIRRLFPADSLGSYSDFSLFFFKKSRGRNYAFYILLGYYIHVYKSMYCSRRCFNQSFNYRAASTAQGIFFRTCKCPAAGAFSKSSRSYAYLQFLFILCRRSGVRKSHSPEKLTRHTWNGHRGAVGPLGR
jgi:hypothetical protein